MATGLAHREGALAQPRTSRVVNLAATAAVVLAVSVLATLPVALVAGYRPLIVRSGSMEPAVHVGDLVFTKRIRPTSAGLGDIVTFHDPTRGRELITHRVVRRTVQGDRLLFVTRGDANTGVERWSVAANGTIGELQFRLPRLGYAVSEFAIPAVRFAFVSLASLLLGLIILRRIWVDAR